MRVQVEEIFTELERDHRHLAAESGAIYHTIVKPTFASAGSHFHMTLWAYMMSAFARIDLYSRLALGQRKGDQTGRMFEFLSSYLPRDELAHRLAIQFWRHTLMHTTRPRRLRDAQSGKEHDYLLHWGADQLPREQHYIVQGGANLALALEFLLEDFLQVLTAMRARAGTDAALEARILTEWPTIAIQRF